AAQTRKGIGSDAYHRSQGVDRSCCGGARNRSDRRGLCVRHHRHPRRSAGDNGMPRPARRVRHCGRAAAGNTGARRSSFRHHLRSCGERHHRGRQRPRHVHSGNDRALQSGALSVRPFDPNLSHVRDQQSHCGPAPGRLRESGAVAGRLGGPPALRRATLHARAGAIMADKENSMSEYKLLINGRLEDGDQTMDVINPATEEVLAVCPRASKVQLDKAVAAAKAAFPGWSKTPIEERKKALLAIAERIQSKAPELARILTQEQGKPLADATGEVYGAAAFFQYFASLDLPVKIIEDSEGRKVEVRRKPLGVIGAIVPWNFPLILMAFKVPSALLSGNTVVLKPAATTPLSTLKLCEYIADLLPSGVLNVIADANDLGGELTKHPDVRKISFTGSTATGKKVMAGAADSLKRVTLELGGNDAGIVLDDLDPKTAAP